MRRIQPLGDRIIAKQLEAEEKNEVRHYSDWKGKGKTAGSRCDSGWSWNCSGWGTCANAFERRGPHFDFSIWVHGIKV